MAKERKIYQHNEPPAEARERFFQAVAAAGSGDWGEEIIPVEEAVGRITAAPVFARHSVPHYHSAAMDGYAVAAENTFGASETSPLRLPVPEKAVSVDTGDPLPPGFNAVIMIEDVQELGGEIEIIAPAPPWQHVRVMGEDIVATELILPANHTIRPLDLGSLLAGGITELAVKRRPRVSIIPTGSELVQPGEKLEEGNIVEFNSRVLGALVREWGGEPVTAPILPDDYQRIKAEMEKALAGADVVVVNAGSSAGSEDYTASLVAELGELVVHGVATKPGKPVVLGVARGKPVLGIPGFPVSAVIAARLFLRPLLYWLQGVHPPALPRTRAVATRRIVSSPGAEEYVRVKLGQVGEKLVAVPLPRGAGMTMSLVRADGLLVVPALSEGYNAGDEVTVELWRSLEEIKNTLVIIGSHDLTLDILGSQLRLLSPRHSISSAHVGSLEGLLALKRGETHLAGTHLLDEETGDYNVSYIKKYLPGRELALVTLAYRQQGLMVKAGNPKEIVGIKDLLRPDVAFINRQRGSGTRILLDYYLRQEGLDPREIEGYQREEFTHMAVAAAVAGGAADVGMGILAAARSLGLDFVPLAEERYELAIPREYFALEGVQQLLEVIKSPAFRQQVEALGGYDLRDTGTIRWIK